MLNQLRSLTKTWVAGVLVAVLVASFAVWGVGDIFRGRAPDSVSVVGRDQISIAEFAGAFNREFNLLTRQTDGQITRDTAIQLQLPQQILDRLAMQSALTQKTRELGLVASDVEIARTLREIEAFRDPITGEYSALQARTQLAGIGMTVAQYENDVRSSIVYEQLDGVMGSGLRPPDVLAAARIRFMGETRSLSVVTIPSTAAAEPAAPTDEELQAFYAEREAAYMRPPMRAFSFATLATEDFTPDAPIDEALLLATFEQQRESLRTAETRDIVEISAPDEDAAREVARRLRAGEEPAVITADLGLAAPTVHDDAEPAALLTAALADAAFAVAPGEVTDPVDGGIAWFVARVDQVNGGAEQTLEEARPRLIEELAAGFAGDKLFDAVDAFELARGQGASLEDAAKAADVPVFSYGLVDASGSPDGAPPGSVLARFPEIVRAAFAQPTTGVVSELQPLGESGYFVFRVDEIADAAVRPLADVEPQVRAQFALTKRAEALEALAEAARASLAGGAAPTDAAAAATPLARGETSTLRRDQTTPTLNGGLLGRAFIAPVGDVFVGAASDGGRVVVRVDAITPAQELASDQLGAAREALAMEMRDDIALIYQNGIRNAYRRTDDLNLMAQALGVDSLQ